MQNLSLWSSGTCRKQNFEDTFCFLFIASYYVFFRWTFSRLNFSGKSFWKAWRIFKDQMKRKGVGSETRFSCNFSGQRDIFLLSLFFFAIFSKLLDWIVLIIGSPVIISVFSHLCRKTNTQGGKTQGLWPRDNVLITYFIRFSLAQMCFVPRPLTPFYGDVN